MSHMSVGLWVHGELTGSSQGALWEGDRWELVAVASIKHIDDVLSADYGSDLYISHRCVQKDKNEELKIDIADNLLKEKRN